MLVSPRWFCLRRARRGRLGEMRAEEGKHLVPAVQRLLRPVGDARGIEEGVAGTVVAVKLVGLAELLEHRLGAVDLIPVGVLIIVAEQAKQRAPQLLRQVDRRDWTLGVELRLV